MNETGELLRKQGFEFGATTGRPRRCGWLDIPALKYAIMLNGVTKLIVTKSDVLSGFDVVKVCTAYKIDGIITEQIPFDTEQKVDPVYTELKGWKQNICPTRSFDELPIELKDYILFIEKQTGVPVSIISVGPDREQTIIR